MGWTANPTKQDLIDLHGEGYGLPLFNQSTSGFDSAQPDKLSVTKMPDWIWSGSGIKAEVYNLLKEKFAEESLEYLHALIFLGGSATDHEVKQYFNDPVRWQLHIVSARRNDCKKMGVVTSFPNKKKIGPFNVPNTIWYVNFRNLKIIVNTP